MWNFAPNHKVVRIANAAAAAQTDVTASIDTRGFTGVCFVALIGSIAAGGTVVMKDSQSDDDGSTDAYSDVAGSSLSVSADTDDNKMLILDIARPRKRYQKVTITRGVANTSIDGILAILYNAAEAPVTQDTTVEAYKVLNAPGEGTA